MTTALYSPEQAAHWLLGKVSGCLTTDSRQTGKGDGFIAWPGAATDGRIHVETAVAAGASACLVERDGVDQFEFSSDAIAHYAGLKAASGPIAAVYFGHPSHMLDVVAVTGTNGKTSVSWWLAQALSHVHRRCGVVGTLGIGEPGAMVLNGLTTPDPVLLQQQLRQFVDAGFYACALEASSIGLCEHRLDSVAVDVAVFTNFTQDHLDYHGSMARYWLAKKALFGWPGLKAAVINIDDPKGQTLSAELDANLLDIWTYSCETSARLQARNIRYTAQGVMFDIVEGEQWQTLQTRLVGHFNVANLLGVIGAMRALGVTLSDAAGACAVLLPVPGRMEILSFKNQPTVVVDYAHTPDALEKALLALRPLAASRGGQLWCVFGCGGDRDVSKRPLMAGVAERFADRVVVTSDNPRNEDPHAIINQMLNGLRQCSNAQVVPDRAAAIAQTLALAQSGDVVLVAGKGHENYQEMHGVRTPFSDRVEIEHAVASRLRHQEPTVC